MPVDKKAKPTLRRETFVEKLMRRILTATGGAFDSLTGRGRQKNDLPSTGDLSERLKRLIDGGIRIEADGRRTAPHLIRLKYSWGQSSDDFIQALDRLKQELLVVAIDHINDSRYRTIAAVNVETKSDILTDGFSLSVGFDKTDAAQREQVQVPAEIFAGLLPQTQIIAPQRFEIPVRTTMTLPDGAEREIELIFEPEGKANLTVGRSRENDLWLNDGSVSNRHASLVMTADGTLRVADIGSTNGTFLNDERIAYGKAFEIGETDAVRFGDVKVNFEWRTAQPEMAEEQTIGDLRDDDSDFETVFAGASLITNELTAKDEPATVFKSASEPETVFNSSQNLETGDLNDESETAVGKKRDGESTVKDEPETIIGGAFKPEITVSEAAKTAETTIGETADLMFEKTAGESTQPKYSDSIIDFSNSHTSSPETPSAPADNSSNYSSGSSDNSSSSSDSSSSSSSSSD